ncbi:2-desacetyl-2-hydroxyethyl bacteriochlorophyllide A dehydrogenase [Agreia bicolorata]|uniref:2-desacetyl-2-hydroxyethyl bacteriochlorophyllide A dehydrogenase n=1 Tax=Agreia bicolorata TaxID=110935 RepID=A0A1T4Y7Y9_9MICO|nr:alcohol dehydrogenase catalytic domain-containing protein [Agreia bicolorata]SKA97411.1 2-desacetyl-2-hydroxyethyl bacteriochlorophyllide A dehydrogenase [Agreia bicolorata]
MRGAAYVGDGRIETITTEQIEPGPGEARIRVAYCGLCGTDLHIAHGNMDARVTTPLVFGHEASGTIEAVGDGVAEWQVGDRVTVMPLLWDNSCAACLAGNQHICQNLTFVGIDSPGALQELWTVPATTLVRLPEGINLRHAALVEPTAVAVHDVRRSELQVGDTVVVLGGGPIGVLIATVARHAGARVAVVELDAARRDRVAALGFEAVAPTDIDATVADWTNGNGADVVFEVSGAAAAVRQATGLLKVRGTLVVVAIHSTPREIDLQRVFWRELRILGARVYQRSDFERAVELLATGVIPVDALVTSVVPLDETGKAIDELGSGQALKVLVDVAAQSGARA